MRLLPLLFLVMACVPRSSAVSRAGAAAGARGPALLLRPTQPDLFVGFNGTPNRLYRNDAETFVDVGAVAGVADARATRAAAFGDWDADGDADLLVGFAPGSGNVLRLYRNDRGRFTDASALAGLAVETGAVRQPVWVDFDGDDDLDLFVAFRDRANMLFRNDVGHLVDVAADVGLADARRSVGAVWADLDADGDDAGRFTDVAERWGLAWGGRTPRSDHGELRQARPLPCE